jgi:chaperone LolA
MRKILFTILGLILLSEFVNAGPLSTADIKNLIARIREKRARAPQAQADFEEEKIVHLLNKPIINSGKVWFQAPNKFRREVKGNSPSVTVSDGHQLWIYYPNFKSAERYSLGTRSPLDAAIATINTALNLENIESTFQISGERIDPPREGYDLELTPRSSSTKRMFQMFRLRLNSDLLAERTEMLQPNGDRIVTTYSNQTRASIAGSTFDFTPPPGTEISTPLGR